MTHFQNGGCSVEWVFALGLPGRESTTGSLGELYQERFRQIVLVDPPAGFPRGSGPLSVGPGGDLWDERGGRFGVIWLFTGSDAHLIARL